MIRTNVVELTIVKGVGYRQKLPAGGSGVVILLDGIGQPGIASISKTSGEAIPAANTPADKYPIEAFNEAITLTAGMPFRKQGAVKLENNKVKADKDNDEAAPKEVEVVVDSADYGRIVDNYTDKNGKLSYELINRDLIKFAHSSSRVRAMIADKESVEKIRRYVVGMKFRNISGNKDLDDAQVKKITELLDEVSPKGVFRAFNDDIKLKLKEAKKK